jgi:hypothetical protein
MPRPLPASTILFARILNQPIFTRDNGDSASKKLTFKRNAPPLPCLDGRSRQLETGSCGIQSCEFFTKTKTGFKFAQIPGKSELRKEVASF